MAKRKSETSRRETAAAKERVDRARSHSGLLRLIDRKLAQAAALQAQTQVARDAAHNGDELPGLALMMLARAAWAIQSVRLLFIAGHDLDAQSALRTIPELLIDLKFIRLSPKDRVELFANFVHVSNWRRYQQLSKHITFIAVSEPGSVVAERKRLHDKHLPSYPSPTQWHATALHDRAVAANCLVVYDAIYRLCCDATHSGPSTIQEAYEQVGEHGVLSIKPTPPDSGFVLMLAIFCFGWLFMEVAEIFALPDVPNEDAFVAEMVAAARKDKP